MTRSLTASAFGRIRVKGPGQNLAARASADGARLDWVAGGGGDGHGVRRAARDLHREREATVRRDHELSLIHISPMTCAIMCIEGDSGVHEGGSLSPTQLAAETLDLCLASSCSNECS